jgi:hypothetical protein
MALSTDTAANKLDFIMGPIWLARKIRTRHALNSVAPE